MNRLIIRQGEVVTRASVLVTDIYVENGQSHFVKPFGFVEEPAHIETIDATDCYVTAGLFDLQVNGSPDCNLWTDPDARQFSKLCLTLLKAGITAFLPTLITDNLAHLKKNIHFLVSMGVGTLDHEPCDNHIDPIKLVVLPGIHLEGPYLSPERPGVHPPQYIRPIVLDEIAELVTTGVKLVTLAPELENGSLAIKYLLKQGIVPSLGHSNATFDQAQEAFGQGVRLVTHLFNALPPIHHREPGAVIAALLNENVYCCIICDGLHVDPEMVRLLVNLKGKDKVILVTDMASIGTNEGKLAGSAINLSQAVTNMVRWGIASFPDAIQMASLNPASIVSTKQYTGEIKEAGRADLVIWDKQTLAIKHVIANGCQVC